MFYRRNIWLMVLCATMLSACSHSLREAQSVVAQSDSLWHAGHVCYDSVQLAQAYETLDTWQWIEPDAYAHACYHYGRLLRAKDNPVAAMEVFINATHSHTRDYHILGRVYSNIGSICHMAGEYSLSYDMYQFSADMFLRNGDSLLYYYGLNNMAFELAEQGKKDSVLLLVNAVERSCTNEQILLKILETKAVVCKKVGQYDSVLYYTSCLFSRGCYEPAIIQLRAQAYSFLGEKDSAVHYANYVLTVSNNIFDMNGALYILTHDDEKKDKQSIRKISADRSDVQKCIEINQGKLSQAVLLLEEDINRKPDRRWILTLVAVLLFVLIAFAFVYLLKKRKEHSRLIHDIDVQKQIHTQLSKTIDTLSNLHEAHSNEIMADIDKSCQILRNNQDIHNHLHWNNYNEMCEYANRYLYNIIIQLQPFNLSEKEIRLCVLVLIKATTEQMAELIPYAHSGIGKFKYTTARKLGTTTSKMREFMLDLLR